MKAIRKILVAAALTAGCVTAAQAHVFVGVGIVGGPVFPVDSSVQAAPPLPVYQAANGFGPAQLPPEEQPSKFAEPLVSSYSVLTGHAAPVTGESPTIAD